MSGLTFKRGIHPPHAKFYSEQKAIEKLMPKGDLVFPMVQHIGAPCKPLVKKSDRVLVGQKIGEASGFVSSPIYSSVSGTVKAVSEILHPNGSKVQAVIIENDGEYTEIETMGQTKPLDQMTDDEIRELIKEGGVVGLGGAGFPTFIKLSPPPDKKIDHILVNGAECEPYLTSDHRIMLEETENVVSGLKVILRLFPDAKGVIGIEENKPDAIKKMQDAVKGEDRIQVAVLQVKYPQGAEKQLIYSITQREVPSGGLPADAGCIVQNIDTVVAIHKAVVEGRPLMRRIVTVTGGAVKNPCNFEVKIGTSYREVVEAAGGFIEEPVKIISGGPMMGIALFSLDVPIIKTSSSILCLSKAEADERKESSCIRCGKCATACPMNLLPMELDKYSRYNAQEAFLHYKGMECIECGSCSFVCPAKRHLVQSIRTTKRTILANRKK
ncbi:electron transport complex subunit RsxC [Anaerotalea alkaliphila]|uniref:Ion-translocating oxidoreductase complex subunit C n=1 Tax=Anaerotalea alkaliphila TaxID=2662126 RepID=A0A7X5HWN6_9FIRM|nr:electron transport complex subunit RsxC [Anaerotalea alkaliphila]NDL67958.1 electron transport complex subunit RsxC [Anaerotalea alkaliphila]